jgi:lysophospholipase L1-like esterase
MTVFPRPLVPGYSLRALPAFLLPWAFVLAATPEAKRKPAAQRIVFVGDSITDGHTYPQLVRQALAEAGLPAPTVINAAVAGDTAAGMRKRLERDVLPRRPTVVALSAGVNDALRKVPPDEYEADVTAIARRLRAEKVPLMLLTPSVLGPRHAEAEKRLAEYNRRLHGLAARLKLPVAEVFAQMDAARRVGKEVLEADQVHPNYEGQRLLARAVLDALGHKDVAVPAQLKLSLMPGVIREWRIRQAPGGKALTAGQVAALKPDAGWKKLVLPESAGASTWWLDHERRRGFAVDLDKLVGPGRLQAVAAVDSAGARAVYFNTGAQLESVWLNGRLLFQGQGWTGWHAGKERIRAALRAGRNEVVIEAGGAFFLSITDNDSW